MDLDGLSSLQKLHELYKNNNESVLQQALESSSAPCLDHLRQELENRAHALRSAINKANAILKRARPCSFVHSDKQGEDAEMMDVETHSSSLPDPAAVLAYAKRLRFTVSANAGLVSLPPAPQQAQMLNSTLFKFHQQQATMVKAAPEEEAVRVKQDALMSLGKKKADDSWQPSALDAFEIPEMPEGWQPGDPLPLPLTVPSVMEEEVKPMAHPVTASTKGSDLLFILNPDLEEVYTSSSEEEEGEDD